MDVLLEKQKAQAGHHYIKIIVDGIPTLFISKFGMGCDDTNLRRNGISLTNKFIDIKPQGRLSQPIYDSTVRLDADTTITTYSTQSTHDILVNDTFIAQLNKYGLFINNKIDGVTGCVPTDKYNNHVRLWGKIGAAYTNRRFGRAIKRKSKPARDSIYAY